MHPPDPADRIVYHPGEQVQCDLWFPAPKIPVADGSVVMLPVLVMVASFSKFITALMIPSRTTADLLSGMWTLLSEQLGAVPRRLIWDNETGIGRRNRLAAGVGEFTGALATRIHKLKAYDPESKGGVERMNGYFETSFLPGRDFASPGDFNTQLGDWLPKANSRTEEYGPCGVGRGRTAAVRAWARWARCSTSTSRGSVPCSRSSLRCRQL